MTEKTENFYNNLQDFHDKVGKIQKLLVDYFNSRNKYLEATYIGIRLNDNKIVESNTELNKIEKQKIESWSKDYSQKEVGEGIYKIELKDKIVFCKVFPFEKNNLVIAGYSLKETISVRLFIGQLSESSIKEKYEKILNII